MSHTIYFSFQIYSAEYCFLKQEKVEVLGTWFQTGKILFS